MKSQILIFIAVLSLTTSCNDAKKDSNSEQKSAVTAEDIKKPEASNETSEVEMMSVITDLNVRNSPGKDGVIIAKLAYGQRAIFLGEETDYKEKIIMRGEAKFDSWKRIKFASGDNRGAITGWVYGGGLESQDQVFSDSTTDNILSRSISRATAAEIKALIGVAVDDSYFYFGNIDYTRSLKEGWILNNEKKNSFFNLNGVAKTDVSSIESDIQVVYTGKFSQGKASGVFKERYASLGKPGAAMLLFEDGKCSSGSYEPESGTTTEVEISNSSECSFDFVRAQAILVRE